VSSNLRNNCSCNTRSPRVTLDQVLFLSNKCNAPRLDLIHHLYETRNVNVTRQTEDDLPAHIKREVEWRTDPYYGLGYYIYSQKGRQYHPIEFIEEEGHWFRLQFDAGQAYTAPRGRIERYAKGTGYWNREDPQHCDHQWYLEEQEQERLATEQRTRELYDQAVQEATAAQPPTLTVKTDVPSLSGDPTLSPFIAPAPTNSPAFTEPRITPVQHQFAKILIIQKLLQEAVQKNHHRSKNNRTNQR
jgi:hypothetical protein